MSHELVSLLGFRTGSVESTHRVRHALAFDLTGLDLRDRIVVSAALRLPAAGPSSDVVSIDLTDPTEEARYGQARRLGSAALTHVPLSTEALSDLQAAAGGFFSVDAVLEGALGEPQSLVDQEGEPVRLIVVAEIASAAAA
jgi:hypothetical protein